MRPSDTIFALSTGSVPSGIAVVRISGPSAFDLLARLSGRPRPAPRMASLRALHGANGQVLDRALVIGFPGPDSFTGEDLVELHLHGGKAVVAAVSSWLGAQSGTRPAAAGEFSRRAFVNGKLDLVSAEALGDLVEAETEAQRRFAVENASGRHKVVLDDWREKLLFLRAMVEAGIDFSDEGDVSDVDIGDDLEDLEAGMDAFLAGTRARQIVRDGFRVAILGAPNAGKSSLLNALAKKDVAIVTAEAGTTRDVIEVSMDIAGYKVVLLDTAGIREADTLAERIGIERALEVARNADLVLLLIDPRRPEDVDVGAGPEMIRIATKCDVAGPAPEAGGELSISSLTGEGLDRLLDLILSRVSAMASAVSGVGAFRERQRLLVSEARDALKRSRDAQLDEILAEELRHAADCIGRVTGAIETEDVLGAIFSRFCIGK